MESSFMQSIIRRKSISNPMGCWIWQGVGNGNGYGRVSILGEKVLAHRLSWQAFNGAIPDDLHVLHHCDQPSCVNPDHLFLGTPKDNTEDCMKKGRQGDRGRRRQPPQKGNLVAQSPLSLKEIADHVGVNQSTVWRWREKGVMPRHPVQIMKLAEILGCTPADLRPDLAALFEARDAG